MGTRYTAVFYALAAAPVTAIGASLFAAVDRVDRQMSNWIPESDLCRINAAPAHAWIDAPAELVEVLAAGLQVNRQSSGAFDMTMGELVGAWGFGPSQHTPAPRMAEPTATTSPTAIGALDVDTARQRVRKQAPIAIDLSGIAKGYGVDQLARCLDGWGIDRYLVGVDGEMRARGGKPDGTAWAVAIEKPTYGSREVSGVMELKDAAIATSGDYRRWIEIEGNRYGHTMNPRLQQPVSNRVAAVTVLAPSCMLADAWATALLVLGEVDGITLARERNMDALFVLRDGTALREVLVARGALDEAP